MDGESENAAIAGKNRGGAVPVMNVGVHNHRGANQLIGLQAADGDGDIVEHAETFAMARERVMEASADVGGAAVNSRVARGKKRASGAKPEGVDGLRARGNFQAHG